MTRLSTIANRLVSGPPPPQTGPHVRRVRPPDLLPDALRKVSLMALSPRGGITNPGSPAPRAPRSSPGFVVRARRARHRLICRRKHLISRVRTGDEGPGRPGLDLHSTPCEEHHEPSSFAKVPSHQPIPS